MSDHSTIIKTRVHPGSSQKKAESRDGVLHLYIHSQPEKGKANKEAIELLAKHLKVKKGQITLSNGEKSREKTFIINP